MDEFDHKILKVLQKNAELALREIGEAVGLSANACWHRIQALKKAGVVQGQRLVLSREALNLDLVVFVMIRTRHHSKDWLQKFRRQVELIEEVINFYRISGDYDYMLQIMTHDMQSFDRIYQRIIENVELDSVTSYFAMEEIISNRQLPLKFL
ncbi:MAG: Lrp/AsnC family transcriptional regulator [Alphaproteobacteria bacterium]|nr:MAG: Lrp/AsnC family transcriptional regulator [Alphaproteobacteria bacterium]